MNNTIRIFYCYLDDPLVGSIAQQYLKQRKEHDQTARDWTRRYAMKKQNEKEKKKIDVVDVENNNNNNSRSSRSRSSSSRSSSREDQPEVIVLD
jgi:hypothetical protein